MLRRVLTLLAILLGALLLLVLGLRWLEPHLIYFPTGPVEHTPAELGIAFQDVTIPTADGESLRAWWIPAAGERAGGTAPVLLFFHGNAGSREHRLHNLQGLRRAGISVLIFDYRGYAGSTGRPSDAWKKLSKNEPLNRSCASTRREGVVSVGRGVGRGACASAAAAHPTARAQALQLTRLIDCLLQSAARCAASRRRDARRARWTARPAGRPRSPGRSSRAP